MVNWKTKINPIFIQDNDVSNHICVYNTVSGENQIVTRTELGIQSISDTWIGFSKQNGSDVVGVFATKCGPVFFVNKKMFPLVGNEWDFVVENVSEETMIFSFVYNFEKVLEVNYKKVIELGTHPYADEEFVDFFTWMSKKKESKTFIDFYTLEDK